MTGKKKKLMFLADLSVFDFKCNLFTNQSHYHSHEDWRNGIGSKGLPVAGKLISMATAVPVRLTTSRKPPATQNGLSEKIVSVSGYLSD